MPDQSQEAAALARVQKLQEVTPSQVAEARAAGYTDAQIVDHLSSRAPEKFNEAAEAGYTPTQILEHLAPQPSGIIDSLGEGLASVPGGIASTLKTYTGAGPVGGALDSAAKALAPSTYTPASIVDKEGFHAGNIPSWVAERVPSMGSAIGAARLMPGPWWLKLLAGAAAGTLMGAGNEAKTAATNRTGDPSATPSAADLTRGGLTAAAENAAGSIGLSRFLPGAGTVTNTGVKGLASAATSLAKTVAAQGASGAAQSAVGQVGQTIGTPGGVAVDPTQVADSAAGNAITGSVLGAPSAARASLNALKYRAITPDLQGAASQFANRMVEHADGENLNAGVIGGGSALRTGADVYRKATAAVKNELSDAVADLRSRVTLPADASNTLDAALKGQPPTDREYATLGQAVQGDPQAANVMNLLRQAHVADIVGNSGTLNDKKFVGGLSALPTALTAHDASKSALAAGAALALEHGAGHIIAYSPEVATAMLGITAATRLADKLTGARAPAGRFVSNFADGTSPVRETVPAQAPVGVPVSPTGPKVPQAPTPWGSPPPATPAELLTPAKKQAMVQDAVAAMRQLARQQATKEAPRVVAGGSIIPPAVKAAMGARANLQKIAATNAAPQPTSQAPTPPASVSKADDGALLVDTGASKYKLPIAPYWNLPPTEAAQRIMRDQLAANVPIKNSGAFLAKTIGVLNTLRDKVQAVAQGAPSVPAAELARFEGVKTQKAAMEYRDHLKKEHPAAASALDRVFSDEAIASQWAKKR